MNEVSQVGGLQSTLDELIIVEDSACPSLQRFIVRPTLSQGAGNGLTMVSSLLLVVIINARACRIIQLHVDCTTVQYICC